MPLKGLIVECPDYLTGFQREAISARANAWLHELGCTAKVLLLDGRMKAKVITDGDNVEIAITTAEEIAEHLRKGYEH